MEQELLNIVKERGEREYDEFRIWLDDLNGVCDIDGHTDIMSALSSHYCGSEEDCLVIQVNTPDDESTVWVGLGELSQELQEKVAEQIRNAEVSPWHDCCN